MALPYLLATPLPGATATAGTGAPVNPSPSLFPPRYQIGQTVTVTEYHQTTHQPIGQVRGVITSVNPTLYGSPTYTVAIQGANPLAAYMSNPPNPMPANESDLSTS